ncbi:MAG: DNA starvation/stationary phase protection protein Dps [Chloroflexi bacterium]|nr:DNA starvation/stationary phase protection protein Dps [Chloroflexota bacterium]
MANERTFPTRIDLSAKTRKTSIALLNQAIADLSDLHSQLKQAHWNLKGMEFIALHELFDTLAGEVSAHVDEIAERLTALGGFAFGTVRMAAAHSKLPEMDVELTSGPEYVKALADRYGLVANSTRKAIDTTDEAGDANTADLFTGISRDLDKRLWFLEAHLIK